MFAPANHFTLCRLGSVGGFSPNAVLRLMSIRRIIWLNALLVLGIGIYGVVTDEPYWRSVGHGPWLYDYLFWCALALNGPSGFAADYAAWFVVDRFNVNWQLVVQHEDDWRFMVQYGLWLFLLWPQWKGYHAVAAWCIAHRGREILLYLAVVAITVIGCAAAYEAWIYGHRPSEFFIDRFFWFVRIAGVALSGIIILAYSQFVKRGRALSLEAYAQDASAGRR